MRTIKIGKKEDLSNEAYADLLIDRGEIKS
jgi:hypothetical protein